MMPHFTPAADLRARTLGNRFDRAAIENRAIETPQRLEAMTWKIEDNRVFWNGLNSQGSDEYLFRGFRIVAGPLPLRYPYAHSQQDGRSQEIRARWRVCADILRDAMSLDCEISIERFPLLPAGATRREITEAQIAQTVEIKRACDLLLKGFVENFWTRLDGKAKTVSFSAAEVCDWIEQETESILSSYGGQWPAWAQSTTQQMAVAA